MTIKETLQALRELAQEPVLTGEDTLDDMATAEHLLLTCEPRLSDAAFAQCMRLFITLRERAQTNHDTAMLRDGVDRFGHGGI